MDKKLFRSIPDLWGGIECSFVRVGDHFMDQLDYCGHYKRGEEDIHRFASLGITAMRYPIVWERHQPTLQQHINWSWTERQLQALRKHGIEPIAGLMHHGNGPAFTNLLSDSFPEYFARYAGAVAEKFPWLMWYTPINEPLTTARFSGLYGIWYPHKRRGRDFARVLFNQMKAIVLAMRAIRKINPAANLLQTEDLAKTYSTPLLRYQADFENHRRWLTYDILCGKLDTDHPLWDYFKSLKVSDETLNFFLHNPCPPDCIGADHYLTSERFLDQNLKQYPRHTHGGNHKHRYADVEAIRVKHQHPWGLKMLLKECWDRYHIPIAITEVHLNGSSDEQIRWLKEVWDIARDLVHEHIDIKSITAWSLLGSYGWDQLLTKPRGHYESGAFHIDSESIQETELASYIQRLSKDPDADHSALHQQGWWKLESRCFYNLPEECSPVEVSEDRVMPSKVTLD